MAKNILNCVSLYVVIRGRAFAYPLNSPQSVSLWNEFSE